MAQARLLLAVALLALALPGCAMLSPFAYMSPRECLVRAMYFESNRSSEEGMLAVGTVVMNRLADKRYPKSVCGVVGQHKQFASGLGSKPLKERHSAQRAASVADAVLSGARHPGARGALHFHQAGRSYPYKNMHYVLEAGGNVFYEKR